MPIHDWTRVDAGIFHHFHHAWIEELQRALNGGILPDEYYALAEQFAGGLGPDVLTLESPPGVLANEGVAVGPSSSGRAETGLLLAPPPAPLAGETDMEFYRRKQNVVAIRHVSGDEVVAVLEIVSPGNKSSRKPFRSFVDKVAELLDQQIHLLILDVLPPGRRDPEGIHAAIWEEISGQEYTLPVDKRLTLACYEAALSIRAYVRHMSIGEELPPMPLFVEPGAHVIVPLEATYQAAFAAVPKRWRQVLQP